MKATHFRAPRSLRDAHLDGGMAGFEGPYYSDGASPRRVLLLLLVLALLAALPLLLAAGVR